MNRLTSYWCGVSLCLVTGLGLAALPQPRGAGDALTEIATELQLATAVPGVAVATVSSSATRVAVRGTRRSDQPDLLEPGDRFHIGSVTKSLTAVLAAALVEDGLLSWNSRIRDVFPELVGSALPSYLDVRLSDLLAHRSGLIPLLFLDDILALPPFSEDPRSARAEFTAWALSQPPQLPAGSDANYSNGGYAVAAAMLERVSQQDYESLLRARVLAPLQIPARYEWPGQNGAAQPWGHTGSAANWAPNDPDADKNQFPRFLTPAGNLSLSLEELARIVRLHLRGLQGRCALLTASSFVELHTPRTSSGFSLGWSEQTLAGFDTSYADGSAGTFYVVVLMQPQRDTASLVAVNAFEESAEFIAAVEASALRLLQLPGETFHADSFESCQP